MDIATFSASFGGGLWTVASFIVALSIIVFVHEYGHYIVGRWSGIHADVFSIGFGPVLLGRTDRHGTYWQIAALPFGGYVKFKGDANAASAPDIDANMELSVQERRSTMHGAPLWARAATVAAGPMFNFMFSIFLLSGLFMIQGRFTDQLKIASMFDVPGEYNIKIGDEIVAINGVRTTNFKQFNEVAVGLPAARSVAYSVLRNGDQLNVMGPYPYPPVVTAVSPLSAAFDAGLRAGDVIVSINGTDIVTFSQLQFSVAGAEGRTMQVSVWRDGTIFDVDLTAKQVDLPNDRNGFDRRWLVGISGGMFFEPGTERLGVLDAVIAASSRTWSIIMSSLSAMWHMITGAISTCNLSGPVTIAETSGQVASMGAFTFFGFIAVMSTAVGLMNLFPIPMLDGGHLVFHAYEAITGRAPSDILYKILTLFGMTLVMGLMFFALGNDILCP